MAGHQSYSCCLVLTLLFFIQSNLFKKWNSFALHIYSSLLLHSNNHSKKMSRKRLSQASHHPLTVFHLICTIPFPKISPLQWPTALHHTTFNIMPVVPLQQFLVLSSIIKIKNWPYSSYQYHLYDRYMLSVEQCRPILLLFSTLLK